MSIARARRPPVRPPRSPTTGRRRLPRYALPRYAGRSRKAEASLLSHYTDSGAWFCILDVPPIADLRPAEPRRRAGPAAPRGGARNEHRTLWRPALRAMAAMALAAVESTNGTAAKSTTKALCRSPMRSSTVPTLDAAPKKKAPECDRPRRPRRSRAADRRASAADRIVGPVGASARAASTPVGCAMRWMNSSAEREADDDAFGQIAEDRQQEGREQHHRVAARGAQQRENACFSAMFQATTASTPASAASGM